MATPAVSWGIIGCGDVCEKKAGPALQGADGSELVAVMRRSADKAKDFAARHNVPLFFDDAQALASCDRVTAVYVASPPSCHLEHARVVSTAPSSTLILSPNLKNGASLVVEYSGTPIT